jgi:pilus assembly protein CpaB
MKPIRLIILGTALAAGIGAAVMVASQKPPEPGKPVIVQAPVSNDAVLVATKELPIGSLIQDGDLRWQDWPKNDVPPNVIRRSLTPGAMVDFKGALVHNPLGPGEPIYADRLIKAGTASFMSAILPSGMRAVAIGIDQQGSQTAGGFILPNDHVDVIHTFRDDAAAKAGVADPMVSETLLRNIKVLAIGQNIQERNNERVVVGSNATLELTPQQVETIILAQRVGQLSLALRSMTDNNVTETDDGSQNQKPTGMTIVRFGVPIQTQSR